MIGMLLTWIVFSIRRLTPPVNQFHEDESSVMEMEGAGLVSSPPSFLASFLAQITDRCAE
jgi:hypothetical protein